jgi:hypothetical protein
MDPAPFRATRSGTISTPAQQAATQPPAARALEKMPDIFIDTCFNPVPFCTVPSGKPGSFF